MFFRVRIHESSGDSFQRFFSDIMGYSTPGFQAVAPWGNWGDGGNDGWIVSDHHYFQVFGPKPGSSLKEVEAVKKSIGDFDKLVAKWGLVRKYTFVMNDRFQGIPAPIGVALEKLKAEKNLDTAASMGSLDLLKVFMDLDEDIKQDLVGSIPDIESDFLDTRAVGELLSFLADKAAASISFLSETAPDFEQKISINGITKAIRSRLESNSYQSYVIGEFLDARDKTLQQAIAQEIRDTYTKSKEVIFATQDGYADLRYWWMVDKLIPPNVQNLHTKAVYRSAAELVLAKYFETCDVYEHPDNAVTA